MASNEIIQCFLCQFFHLSGFKFNIPIFPHFFHLLQQKSTFLLASAEARAANRDKEQDRDNDRNGRSPRDSRSNSRRRSPEGGRRSASPKAADGNVLYIGNLSRRIEENEVREAFEKCGKVSSVELVKDPYTNECRGFAFVTFDTSDDATEGLRLDNTEIDGRKIRVEKSKRSRGHKKTPGEYLGHYKSRGGGGGRSRRSPSPRYRRRSPRSSRRNSRERHSDRRDRDRDSRRDRHRSRSRDRYNRSSRDRSDSRSRRRR